MTSHETLFKFLTALINLIISIITFQSTVNNKENSSKKEEFPH